MSGVRMLHFLKDWGKFIQIHWSILYYGFKCLYKLAQYLFVTFFLLCSFYVKTVQHVYQINDLISNSILCNESNSCWVLSKHDTCKWQNLNGKVSLFNAIGKIHYCKRCYFRATKFSRLAAQKHIRGLLNSRWADAHYVILVLHNVNIIQWIIHLHVCM